MINHHNVYCFTVAHSKVLKQINYASQKYRTMITETFIMISFFIPLLTFLYPFNQSGVIYLE